jgi:hypothetical protein
MDAVANPLIPAIRRDTSLATVLAALAPHDGKALVLAYDDGRTVQTGYHVTEVKAGSFVTLDCGGNPDAWRETVLQVEDIPAAGGAAVMTVGKFRSILAAVDRKLSLDAEARLTVEVSRPDEPMRVYDVTAVAIEEEGAILRLGARPAICKPRHRAAEAEACCAPARAASSCCA